MGGRKAAHSARKMNGMESLFGSINDRVSKDRKAKEMKDNDLFSINVDKSALGKKRAKLAADRFKMKERGPTPTEDLILKKLRQKNAPEKVAVEAELCDLWATAPLEVSKREQEYKAFAGQQMVKVRAVMEAEGGHSFNPSAQAHLSTLKKIVGREADDIEKKLRKDYMQQIHNNKLERRAMKNDEDESEDEDEEELHDDQAAIEKIEVPQKAVDRTKKLTKPERNKRNEGLEKRRQEVLEKRARKFDRQFDAIPAWCAADKRETREHTEYLDAIKKELQDERDNQEATGVVKKYTNTGQFKYKMRKEDFQMEDELAASMRQMKSTGKHSMLREKQDDFFRCNKIETDAEFLGDRKRHRKLKFKMKARQGGVYGTLSEKLQRKNKKMAEEQKERDNHAMMLQNDMIFI